MKFTPHQITCAIEFKRNGLAWTPSVGNYVYDANNAVKASSPFQENVFFLLNYDCFIDRLGGEEQFVEAMTWLPTWEDARGVLKSLDVEHEEVQAAIVDSGALREGTELDILYDLIAKRLPKSGHKNVNFRTMKDQDHSGSVSPESAL
jgi:hypothetical protein